MLSFDNKKTIKFIIKLGKGSFGSSKNDEIILQGFRSSVLIEQAGGEYMGTLYAKIYGLSKDTMNSLATIWWDPNTVLQNKIKIYAIDGKLENIVFSGTIYRAWADYQAIPDVFLYIKAQAGYFEQLQPSPHLSFNGEVDVAMIFKKIASELGFLFENNGVDIKMNNVSIDNTSIEQMRELSRASKCGFALDSSTDPPTVVITKDVYSPRLNSNNVTISSKTGLIGYPNIYEEGINLSVLYNSYIQLLGKINLVSDVQQANGDFTVFSLSHTLESERPGGSWMSNIRALRSSK